MNDDTPRALDGTPDDPRDTPDVPGDTPRALRPVPRSEPKPVSDRGRPHGRPVSWAFVAAFLVFFAAGGLGLVIGNMALFWSCLAAVVLMVPVGRGIRIMDDTMGWTHARTDRHQKPARER
ncbi:hypothetical protein [Streptosporangium pseudovulgare]|uniref:DUF3040 domain-containing protein n=1 Tax=Streptosporangium pseudovulgare TaxID=35765 RepID=A0ABQ2RIY1_9ACTN|nr:hypothetical protein [Streptosporangium pseudovulgare]GGQ28148.1 hypothetical protein GCM10010140_67980 [Streptosporangium pseudovulgare]